MKSLPYFCRGEVVRGFGRGSKELGIPTDHISENVKKWFSGARGSRYLAGVQGSFPTNFPDSVVDSLPADVSTGIYYGWACVGNSDIHKMVTSIGWNPYYKNTKKSMETHVIHKFKEDFYGEILSVVLVGFIRSEKSFPSLEDLIATINSDIEEAKVMLELPEHSKLKEDNFFTSTTDSSPASPSSAASTSQSIINGH